MGKTRHLLKKIRNNKGTFLAKLDSIKDRSSMDLREAEDVKKTCQEYSEELYKKDRHNPDNHNGVISHLEPDILECEVKWALGSITMNKANSMDMNLSKLLELVVDREAWHVAVYGVTKRRTRLSNWNELIDFLFAFISTSWRPITPQYCSGTDRFWIMFSLSFDFPLISSLTCWLFRNALFNLLLFVFFTVFFS